MATLGSRPDGELTIFLIARDVCRQAWHVPHDTALPDRASGFTTGLSSPGSVREGRPSGPAVTATLYRPGNSLQDI